MTAKLLLILRFYRSAMLLFCGAASLALAWVAKVHGTPIVPALLLGKALIYPLFLYVWIIPRYSDEFYYYRNLGIRRPAACRPLKNIFSKSTPQSWRSANGAFSRVFTCSSKQAA